jgi:6-phosphogluconolactonase
MCEYEDTEKAALEYEQVLRAYFKLQDGELPRFDLVLLGMGEEGHTLSLFPGTKALHSPPNRLVVRNWVGKLYTERITLTAAVVNRANKVMFSVTRGDKALALKAIRRNRIRNTHPGENNGNSKHQRNRTTFGSQSGKPAWI